MTGLCVLLAGCTVSPIVDLYNRSGTQIRVIVGDDSYLVAPAATKSFDYPKQEWGQVRVCVDKKLRRYAIPFPPNNYFHGVAFLFLRSHIRVQINPDGRVWILKRGESFPIREDADQPGPFPLIPQDIGTC